LASFLALLYKESSTAAPRLASRLSSRLMAGWYPDFGLRPGRMLSY